MFLYAQNAEDAKHRVELLLKYKNGDISEIKEVSHEEALAEIKMHFDDERYPNGAAKEICDHILTLPT